MARIDKIKKRCMKNTSGYETTNPGYETTRLWICNNQTTGYKTIRLDTKHLEYEMSRIQIDHNPVGDTR